MTTDHSTLFIGGEWVAPSSGQTITVISASTEDVIGSVPEVQEADVVLFKVMPTVQPGPPEASVSWSSYGWFWVPVLGLSDGWAARTLCIAGTK